MTDDLRERVDDDLLTRATVALHDLDCDPECGDSLTTMSGYARQAQAVLAALDVAGREAKAREDGRREALEQAHQEAAAHPLIVTRWANGPVKSGTNPPTDEYERGRQEAADAILTHGYSDTMTVRYWADLARGTERIEGVPPPKVSDGSGPIDYNG